jgi:peroxiredoxin (alkyl hydroperoxide reductase subunit C)
MSEICCGLQVGQDVPDFKLETFEPSKGDFGEISLETLKANKKWAILFFYPADFTFVCATEFAALAEQYERFKKMGAEVITVSTDTKFVHLAWQREEKMLKDVKYPMGSDTTGNVSRMFGVYDENTGLALRGTFIISPDGKLLNSEVNYYNMGRNIEELIRKFKANLHLAEHTEEGCPSKWKEEGDKTLKPSAKLVGKVYEEYEGK